MNSDSNFQSDPQSGVSSGVADNTVRRVGLFGGSFDPFHFGHLYCIKTVLDQKRVDQVMVVPNAVSPLKQSVTLSVSDRLDLINRYIQPLQKKGYPIEISTIDCDKPGPSYAIDTLNALASALSINEVKNTRFYWITGTDALLSLHKWKDPEALVRNCHFLVLLRGGTTVNEVEAYMTDRFPSASWSLVPAPAVPISSTQIKAIPWIDHTLSVHSFPRMIIGLTGRAGSGKSTAARLLKDKADIIGLDELGHAALHDADIKAALTSAHGNSILENSSDPNSAINRAALRERVLASAEALAQLNRLSHPFIYKAALRTLTELSAKTDKKSAGRPIILDGALLYEIGLWWICSRVIVIDADDAAIQRYTTKAPLLAYQRERAAFYTDADVIIVNPYNANLERLVHSVFNTVLTLGPK